MKIFTAEQIRQADAFTIQNEPIASVDLMERAAKALCNWIVRNFNPNTPFKIFAGPGNNGGDAWALARLLIENNFGNIEFFLLNLSGKISPDSEINRDRLIKLNKAIIHEITASEHFPSFTDNDIIIDGLFGSGLSRPLEGLPGELVRYFNSCTNNRIVSIDVPSGLFCENNTQNNPENIVKANYTLSFQFPKYAFFLSDNTEFVGKYHILDIGLSPAFIAKEPSNLNYLTQIDISPLLRKRKKYSHKGSYGHGLLIAGSYGMMGAAILAAKAALRSGIGLLTTHIPRYGYEILQTSVPESLVSIDESDIIFTELCHLEKFNAVAIGPGINTKHNTVNAVKDMLANCKIPLVIDADALNIIATKNFINNLPKNSILTPHPKEFDRLFGKHSSHYHRIEKQIQISRDKHLYIILKGAGTSISTPKGELFINTTGNPGMATGGSGDVLTGMLLGLLAQGFTIENSCKLAVYLHGQAADIAVEDSSEYSILPTDIINSLGRAFACQLRL